MEEQLHSGEEMFKYMILVIFLCALRASSILANLYVFDRACVCIQT